MAKSGPKKSGDRANGSDDIRRRLIDATVVVLARDGYAQTSGRVVAAEAGTVNGSIFYYFGSMDGLLASTLATLTERGIERVRVGLGGSEAATEWPHRLGEVLRTEAVGTDARAVVELLVGARGSELLGDQVQRSFDQALRFAHTELSKVLPSSAITDLLPVNLMADLGGAAFLGLVVLMQNGRRIDVDRLGVVARQLVQLFGAFTRPPATSD
jgi:AcrR family transcriptional regulator